MFGTVLILRENITSGGAGRLSTTLRSDGEIDVASTLHQLILDALRPKLKKLFFYTCG